jgi:hypothetical protein
MYALLRKIDFFGNVYTDPCVFSLSLAFLTFFPMSCAICKKFKGKEIFHDDGCPLGKSVLCRRCHHRGHFTSDCTEDWPQWERPTSLEELIPSDVRKRYGIITHTPISFPVPRGAPGTDVELSAINEVVIPDDYSQLKEFIDTHKIKVEKITKESRFNCMKAIAAWGVSHGYRVVMKCDMAIC